MDKQEHLEIDVPFVGPQPTTPRPTVAHRVSLSPNVSPKKSLSPQQMRKSTRSKTSTVIYVDGYAIKKDNNYVLKGGQYVFALVDNSEAKPQRTNSFTTAKKAVADAKAPRKVTAAEQERLEKKADLEKAIQQKAVARQTFLKTHINVFKPFLEPKVLGRIQTYNVPSSLSETFSVYMQPDAIKADLRDYQLEALQWMSKMYQRNVGMILGDEMGLGKTLQTISLICHIKEAFQVTGPSLVLSPLSVLDSWSNEIKKWAPTLKFVRLHSSNPESLDISNLAQYDIVVTTYEMAKAPVLRHLWSRQQFNLLVLDEGHRIKSAETQISQAVRRIHCENRLILTGTPLANNLVETWSLLNFLVPDVFTTSEPFAEAFDLTLNRVDPERLEDAHRLLKVFMLRRLKTEVEKLMPKKIETKVICPLSNLQRWWYKAILLKDMNLLVTSDSKKSATRAQILNNLIMQLRKVCLHPYLFPEAEDIDSTTLKDLVGSSGKLTVLDKLLCSLYEKGHRVCLFSQFTSVLDVLDDYCTLRGWKYCRFDGSTARAKRNYVVNSFNAPNSEKFLFLMSTRSGGMGLNLQTADTCILFDSDWNPQPDIQAMARVHRIGQNKTVHVYRLITEGTVEQRMVERAEKKLYLEKMVTRDGASENIVEVGDVDKLMSTLKFGCNAVFGEGQNTLPTDEDIALITDRNRTDNFTAGKLQGGADASAKGYDATKELTSTTDFGGIDFKKIRDKYAKSKKPGSMHEINALWREKKRERKSRIVMIESENSGWGSKSVPVLASNDYDLESGERSVFAQELQGHSSGAPKKKKANQPSFESQDHCQACGDGGYLLCCPRCPVALHVRCSGVGHANHFLCCSHHHCSICGKPAASAGGFMFPCSSCVNCYCEDHLPAEARFVENCHQMEELGYQLKNGVYVHCSAQCEQVAIKEFGFKVPGPKKRDPCPPSLEVDAYFGGKVDENLEAPGEVMLGKRRRERDNC